MPFSEGEYVDIAAWSAGPRGQWPPFRCLPADQKYKGKRLKIAGTVAGISKNAFDSIYVKIATSNDFSSVHANSSPEQAAASLQKGEQLTGVRAAA